MRVPAGEGVIMRPAVDARFVSGLSPEEISENLRYLIEHLEEDGDTEDDDEE